MAKTKVEKAEKRADVAIAQLKAFKVEKAGVIARGLQSALAGGTTFVLSWWKTRYPARAKAFGIPVEFFIAGAALLAISFEKAGDYEGEVFGIGVGAICEITHGKGAEIGFKGLQDAKKKAAAPP